LKDTVKVGLDGMEREAKAVAKKCMALLGGLQVGSPSFP
jgi:hypothetical protein